MISGCRYRTDWVRAGGRRTLVGRGVAIAGAVTLGLLGVASPALASSYTMTDLGSLGGGFTLATAINASGQITGQSDLATEVQVPCEEEPRPKKERKCFAHPSHAFVWSAGTMTDLGTLDGPDADSQGSAINDVGEVVGFSSTANGSEGFTDQNGVMTPFNVGFPAAINDSGEIAGGGSFPVENAPGDVFEQAFTYKNGKTTVFGLFPGGVESGAVAINRSGEVVGEGDDSESNQQAWKYQHGRLTDIGTLGGAAASASAINDRGQIVGWSQAGNFEIEGFLYTGSKMTALGLNLFPDGINDHDVIVGQEPGGPEGAFVGTPGHFQNLNDLVPANSGFTLTHAVAINNNGQIVAQGINNTTRETHSFLLTPN
jgi:probable HAF family extracellular repeat protein